MDSLCEMFFSNDIYWSESSEKPKELCNLGVFLNKYLLAVAWKLKLKRTLHVLISFEYEETQCEIFLSYECELNDHILLFQPAHEIMVLITQANREGSGEPALPRSLTWAFAVRIHEVWNSLFAHMKHGSRLKVQPKIRHLALLDGCECVYGRRKVP